MEFRTGPSSEAATRRLEMRSWNAPDAGTVTPIPLNTMLLLLTWFDVGSGTKPLPTSAEITASVVMLFAPTRLVMLTGNAIVKFPASTAPGFEPEQEIRMSPSRSVRPSVRTGAGTAVAEHRPPIGDWE